MHRVISCVPALLLVAAPAAAMGAPEASRPSVVVVVVAGDALATKIEQAAEGASTRQGWGASIGDRRTGAALARCTGKDRERCIGKAIADVEADAVVLIIAQEGRSDDGEPRIVLDGLLIETERGTIFATLERHCLRCHDPPRLALLAGELTTDLIRMRAADLAPYTSIRIVTEPADAVIFLNDFMAGPAGVAYVVAPGPINLRAEREGYEPRTQEVIVRPNQELVLEVTLRKVGGGIVPNSGQPSTPNPVDRNRQGRSTMRDSLPWILMGTGAASAALGVTWLATHRPAIKDGVRQPESRSQAQKTAGIAATAIGVGLAGAGLGVLLWDRRSDRTIGVEPTAGGAVLTWGGSF